MTKSSSVILRGCSRYVHGKNLLLNSSQEEISLPIWIQFLFLSNFTQDKFVSYNKNYNRNINFNIIGHISTNSICITSVQVVIYYSVYTHNLDVLKVTQSGWVSKPGTVRESIYSASRVHITSSALHEGQFGLRRSSKRNQGQL